MRYSTRRNRSEIVRHRRKEEAAKRLQDSAVLSRHVVAPITSRNGSSPSAPGRRGAVRRRKEAAVSMPGIEIHMPTISFSGTSAKWRFVSFGMALLLGAALYAAWSSPIFQAGPAQISGNTRLPAEEIEAAMASNQRFVFELVPAELERRLRLNFPELLDARVSVWLPNSVVVDVKERTPVLAWHQGGGYTWIDASGVAFRPRGTVDGLINVQAENAPTPVTTEQQDPLTPSPFVSPDLVQAALALAPHAPNGTEIIFDAHHGLGWTDSRGWQVFFGEQARDVALRLRVYDSMVRLVDSKGVHPAFISVEYPQAPYYRMTQ